ncbi:mandelate racemase/muconate lactonizing enzyme family protein [Brevibacillus fluminis]|uniref:mandelate racemase/muconate lactonizing enzyme family protein n=1 Tax=Brevibacillus fluminis TaxID=511487 RepID=UPI003F88B041
MKDEQTCCSAASEPALTIERVETYPLLYRLQEPYGDANGYKQYRSCYLIRVITIDGVDGWGECIDWLPTVDVGFHKRIIPFLIGKNAANRLALTGAIKKWHQRAATAVSMALTEIVAKWAGISVCELWGGRLHEQIPVYASMQSYVERSDWQKQSLRKVEQALVSGFSLMKLKIGGKPLAVDQAHIDQVVSFVDGRAQIALDANQSYDLASARNWERCFQRWSQPIAWLEEPLPLVQTQAPHYHMLRQSLSVPIAGGENLGGLEAFLPFLRSESFDLVQADPQHHDDLEAYRCTLAGSRQFGARCSPHTFDGALSRLYALMAQALLPPYSKMPDQAIEPIEWDVMENPLTQLFFIRLANGYATVPSGSGIGCEPDMAIIRAYGWDGGTY